jgi:hypothetical protein
MQRVARCRHFWQLLPHKFEQQIKAMQRCFTKIRQAMQPPVGSQAVMADVLNNGACKASFRAACNWRLQWEKFATVALSILESRLPELRAAQVQLLQTGCACLSVKTARTACVGCCGANSPGAEESYTDTSCVQWWCEVKILLLSTHLHQLIQTANLPADIY